MLALAQLGFFVYRRLQILTVFFQALLSSSRGPLQAGDRIAWREGSCLNGALDPVFDARYGLVRAARCQLVVQDASRQRACADPGQEDGDGQGESSSQVR